MRPTMRRRFPSWIMLWLAAGTAAWTTEAIRWEELPVLPDPVGFAAPFAGVTDGALLVAGGTNFPDGSLWLGGAKAWHDRIFILETPAGPWREAGRLPGRRAYGVSVTIPAGVLCIGGSDDGAVTADVILLRRSGGGVVAEPWPALPAPLHYACGALVGRTVYVAGGLREFTGGPGRWFYALDLDAPPATRAWRAVEPWPGSPRQSAVAGSLDGAFYLFGGLNLVPGADGALERQYLSDAWRYTPAGGWKRLAAMPAALQASPSPAPALGVAHLLVLGGDDGRYLKETPALQDRHPGFPAEVHGYHTITDSWTVTGSLPRDLGPDPVGQPNAGRWPPIVAPVVPWAGGWAVVSGEVRPGTRTPRVLLAKPVHERAGLGWLNTTTLGLYLAGMLGIGLYFVRRERNTDTFFRGGQHIPWWAAGLSIYATMLSSITFMALPAKVYATDWAYSFGLLSLVLITPVVTIFYLPFFRRLNVTSAYEYLEHRFNGLVRQVGSAVFILFQLGRMSIVLYLPAVALATVSSFDVYTCIVVTGLACVVYTMIGGIEAVIWTDVAQAVVLLGGALVSLLLILFQCEGSFGGMVAVAQEHGKFLGFTEWWNPDLTQTSVILVLLGSGCNSLLSYTASQDVVQRYVTTATEAQARRSIWLNVWISLPGSIVFYAVGTAFFLFYRQNPDRLDPTLATDAIFPLFIVRELPAGVAGLVIAGLLAAAQSTLSSSLNSVATAWVTDFHVRYWPQGTDRSRLRVAQGLILGLGLMVTAVACLMASTPIGSLMDAYYMVIGSAGGALAALFILGIFTRRAHAAGVLVGAAVSIATLLYVQTQTKLSFFLYGVIGIAVCVGVGYLASLVLPSAPKDLKGLTRRDLV
jgi:SSS family solute:Na+ symporter